MQINLKQGQLQQEETELLVVNLFEGAGAPGGALKAVDDALSGLVTQLMAAGDIKGKLGATHLLYTNGALPARRVLITGLGKEADFSVSVARKAAAAAAKHARDLGVSAYTTIVHGAGRGGLSATDAAEALVEGSLLGAYRFNSYRRDSGDKDTPAIAEMTILEADAGKLDDLRAGLLIGQAVGDNANWARDLVNEPANYLTPSELARRVREQAERAGLQVAVLGEAEMAELGAGSYLGIAQGSDEEAQFIVLEHQPKGVDLANVPTVVFVGKAITFDTGGISLKPNLNMWKMKDDMGGGAATAGALVTAARLNLPVHAVGLIPAVENMPGGDAIKPGDVVTAMNGKTVEIISTDAEGRQVMADALCYAQRYNPDAVLDIATLTGSIGIALGLELSGLFCDDDILRDRLLRASEFSGEPLWPMPVWKPYRRLIDSDVADMKNTGGRYGGAVIAAMFLREFAGEQPWAHLDIAGTAWQEENSAFSVRGGTGFGMRTLFGLLRAYATG
ncbi:MAG: leucyl aminopeptidase [Anaerolineae bacterium]|nr:leucyl aminopeptidase [Anaerolineae bacterium]